MNVRSLLIIYKTEDITPDVDLKLPVKRERPISLTLPEHYLFQRHTTKELSQKKGKPSFMTFFSNNVILYGPQASLPYPITVQSSLFKGQRTQRVILQLCNRVHVIDC
uniref:Uncharacterized protein n=1 Tax=Anguilla anguilla TaxID=7936 RepID=A0A0E9XUN4_ANGAN